MSEYKIRNNPPLPNIVENSDRTKETTETKQNINIFGFEIKEETLNTILTGAVDIILADSTFTKDDAAIFVAGEKEIEELIKNAQNNQNLFETIFDPNKTEREIREKYANEHPEYAAVMQKGNNVQKKHDEAREETRLKWIEDNPEPSDIMQKGGLFGMTFTDEYKDWLKNKDNYLNNFEQEYIQNNPDYANLKEAQDKDKNISQVLFGS